MVDAITLRYLSIRYKIDFVMRKAFNRAWTPNFAYAIGLITTDGSLSSDGRHIDISSKDKEQLENVLTCLVRNDKISKKKSGMGRISLRIQFSDVSLYKFLLKIGLTPNKSKTLGGINIPNEYFFDFLRGHFDGDGTFYSYQDLRWKNSYMFYLCFVSASKNHIMWLREKIKEALDISGSLTKAKSNSAYQLKYAKKEAIELIEKLYYNHHVVCLSRKRTKITDILNAIEDMHARVL
ncbi:MAG: Intein-containing protein [Candidatus Collierbacteria bacterium GW2011_GWC2_44_18]|uniref:Intein-containing protein n=2 Tax=Microgenomates group TaxID=1794810 RepID=A0A0G1J417_9BACT|nr:MAG: Intein-containing protein [Microgenomates group bacterium GW2011_GWC1_44_10]KKT48497.1 MAG: Intein-containing protein [Candidatus Collierbacteria bacterium GW2011_GWC2_44_18]KKT66361.1 MAG: Intein-containing protein [Candidatus Woesebacteria bacterium GW2011_GWA2_44_33]